MPKTSARDNHRISHGKPLQRSFSSYFSSLRYRRRIGPPPDAQQSKARRNPVESLAWKKYIRETPLLLGNPNVKHAPTEMTYAYSRVLEVFIESQFQSGTCTLAVPNIAARIRGLGKGSKCRTVQRAKRDFLWAGIITVAGRERDNKSRRSDEVRINWDHPYWDELFGRNRESDCTAATSDLGDGDKQTPLEVIPAIGVYSQSSVTSTEEERTDPEPEPIHEAKQERMFDNVYSDNTAEKPVNAAIPDVVRVQEFRQTIANWFHVTLSFQLTLWLLGFLLVRRWNITAFLRDIDRNHKPRLFRSQEAAWRFLVADYQTRGPVLESYPPEKPPARAVAVSAEESPPESIQPSALSDQQKPRRSERPLQIESPPSAKGVLCSADRVLELLREYGIDSDVGFLAWLEKHKPVEWPTDECRVRREIERYVRYVNRKKLEESTS